MRFYIYTKVRLGNPERLRRLHAVRLSYNPDCYTELNKEVL